MSNNKKIGSKEIGEVKNWHPVRIKLNMVNPLPTFHYNLTKIKYFNINVTMFIVIMEIEILTRKCIPIISMQ